MLFSVLWSGVINPDYVPEIFFLMLIPMPHLLEIMM